MDEDLREDPENDVPTEDKPAEEEKPKRKRGRKPKKQAEALDPAAEAEDCVTVVDELQGLVSPKLRFTEKERAFHLRSVELVVKHYEVSPSEAIVLAHAGASVCMILGRWIGAAVQWARKPKPADEVKSAKPVKVEVSDPAASAS